MNLTCFGGKVLVKKLWPLLYKRAELDLKLTKSFKQEQEVRKELKNPGLDRNYTWVRNDLLI